MKLKEIFELINEEAKSKQIIEANVSNTQLPIMTHLMKLYFYDKDNEHWKGEIAGFLNSVPLMKGSKKLPPYKVIVNALWNSSKDTFKRDYYRIADSLNRKYSKRYGELKLTSQDYNKIYNLCDIYFNWLSEKLSKDGVVYDNDIFNELEKLLTKN